MTIVNIFAWGVVTFVGILLLFGLWKLRVLFMNRAKRSILDDERPR